MIIARGFKIQETRLQKKYANCTDVESRRIGMDDDLNDDQTNYRLDLGRHLRDPDDYTARRTTKQGGFCEVI